MARRPHGPQPPRRAGNRIVNAVPVRERFLIVCEGEKTEPLYFESFKAPGFVLTVEGTGRNTLSLVEEAIRLRGEKEAELRRQRRETFDQCWCVFDLDSFPPDAFNSAIAKAEAAGFRVAYSNEAFELWYLLHFHYHDAAISRQDYIAKLSDCLGRRYEKNSRTLPQELRPRQPSAIQNARRLLSQYPDDNPQRNKPSTTVHQLVEALNRSAGF